MPLNPSLNSVHINRPLSSISVAFMQDEKDFIADRVFPSMPVANKSNSYFIYDREYWFRSEMQKRAPSTESAGGGYKPLTDTYNCDVWSLHKDIDDQIRANEDSPLNSDRDAAEWLSLQGLISKERNFASKYLKSGVWTFEAKGVTTGETAPASFDPEDGNNNDKLHWSNAASTPIEDIRQAKRYIKRRTAQNANVLTLGQDVYDILLDHPDIIARINSGQTPNGPAMANKEMLARIFDLDEVLVASGIQNVANEGAPESTDFIVGKHALLSFRPKRPSLLVPSAGYTFGWTGYLGGAAGGLQVKKFRLEHLNSDRVEGEMAYDQKVVSPECGYFFSGIVA